MRYSGFIMKNLVLLIAYFSSTFVRLPERYSDGSGGKSLLKHELMMIRFRKKRKRKATTMEG